MPRLAKWSTVGIGLLAAALLAGCSGGGSDASSSSASSSAPTGGGEIETMTWAVPAPIMSMDSAIDPNLLFFLLSSSFYPLVYLFNVIFSITFYSNHCQSSSRCILCQQLLWSHCHRPFCPLSLYKKKKEDLLKEAYS